MFIVTKSGYTEITENIAETMMDISMRNRGKSPLDCEYTVEASPERYKVTEAGLIAKTDEELVADGLMTAAELTAKKNASVIAQRKAAYAAESDPLYLEAVFDGGDLSAWKAKVEEIKARYPKV